jgi:hypothetical protein
MTTQIRNQANTTLSIKRGNPKAIEQHHGTRVYRELLLRNHFFAYWYFDKCDAVKSGIVNEIRRQVRNKGVHFFKKDDSWSTMKFVDKRRDCKDSARSQGYG